ncbi:hypothetical protein J5J10_11280 [Ciceribacter sp. L1K23]|uniref:hypothetical protein n=1 Tax=unclassified Ciceribacter TaxID=2628820 RepID=UPI001ABEC7CD|nr:MULTISPECIES: hypothetical protein [unclassified Ciceribacter]MBO3759583.1 hypothetical protein [Ciceribacter sp. L1K22]MBR0556258.1 hypothetical protein [Ciceribacter sp. L1K23]
MFLNDEYLIRGVAGRLFRHFLQAFTESGTTDFFNKEIRRHQSLLLPDYKDNLETRLILLTRRLDERRGNIRLERPERGRVRLVVDRSVRLLVSDHD